MLFILGLSLVVGSVLLGFAPQGELALLWRPFEFVVLFGAALGSFLIANPPDVIRRALFGLIIAPWAGQSGKRARLQLLAILYALFKLSRAQGHQAVADHVEDPTQSPLFRAFPAVLARADLHQFLADHLRALGMEGGAARQLDDAMAEEIQTLRAEAEAPAHALENLADSLPAFGIVAAVMGVILAMADVERPAADLGSLIAGALTGTFLGVLASYGLVGPAAANLRLRIEADLRAFECARLAIASFAEGAAPAFAVEAARKALARPERPSFDDLERVTRAVSGARELEERPNRERPYLEAAP